MPGPCTWSAKHTNIRMGRGLLCRLGSQSLAMPSGAVPLILPLLLNPPPPTSPPAPLPHPT